MGSGTGDTAGGRCSSDISFQRAAVRLLMLTLGPVSGPGWSGRTSGANTRVPWPVCVQLVVVSDVPEHLQNQAATQNDSSADVVVAVLLPALMICVRPDWIADPQWFVITCCNWLFSSVCCQLRHWKSLSGLLCHLPDRNLVSVHGC